RCGTKSVTAPCCLVNQTAVCRHCPRSLRGALPIWVPSGPRSGEGAGPVFLQPANSNLQPPPLTPPTPRRTLPASRNGERKRRRGELSGSPYQALRRPRGALRGAVAAAVRVVARRIAAGLSVAPPRRAAAPAAHRRHALAGVERGPGAHQPPPCPAPAPSRLAGAGAVHRHNAAHAPVASRRALAARRRRVRGGDRARRAAAGRRPLSGRSVARVL